MAQQVVLGVDAGGTSTRCAVASPEGEVLGYGRAAGANLFSSDAPAAAFEQALREALAKLEAPEVRHAVFGLRAPAPWVSNGPPRSWSVRGAVWTLPARRASPTTSPSPSPPAATPTRDRCLSRGPVPSRPVSAVARLRAAATATAGCWAARAPREGW